MPTTPASDDVARRIWRRDPSVFVGPNADPAVFQAILGRLGWLDAADAVLARAAVVQTFAAEARADGLTHVYLLGMGGSSLCAEVLRDVPGHRPDACQLTVLDTTDERAIHAVTGSLVPAQAMFIVASKSGTTTEVTSLEEYFWSVASHALGPLAGRHFVAITDPGTPLEALAARRGYRKTFVNPPDIGGRYSALSLFGLVPAALLGWDVSSLGQSADRMAAQCREDGDGNPGVALGTFMAEHSEAARDKLTLLVSTELAAFGPWVEQLVAESTGKEGRGVLPVVGEPFGPAAEYGRDRMFVALIADEDRRVPAQARDLEAAGHPVFRIETSAAELGAEFFRWEFATAVAGARLALNPFDEPNVREAKARTKAQLEVVTSTGAFRIEPPFAGGDGYSRREFRPRWAPAADRRRYLALLDYLPADPDRAPLIEELRAVLRRRLGLATTYGIGPRYLHSTGQFHKGGPNTGIFVLLTAADATNTPVPGTGYSFSTLKQAQALGDFDALAANGREVVHYHLDDPTADFCETLERLLVTLATPDGRSTTDR